MLRISLSRLTCFSPSLVALRRYELMKYLVGNTGFFLVASGPFEVDEKE